MNANELRQNFLEDSDTVLTEIRDRTLGLPSKHPAADDEFLLAYWNTYQQIILKTDDPINFAWKDKATSTRIDEILCQVADSKLTPEQGKQLMALVSMGIEIEEIPKIRELLTEINLEKKNL